MNKWLLGLVLVVACWGQQQNNVKLTAPPPSAVGTVSVNVIGNQGNQTFYVWVIAKYTIGQAQPISSQLVSHAPNALNASNLLRVNWSAAAGATGYDVLLTTTPYIISPCTCAVVLGTTSTTRDITSTSGLLSYTLNTIGSATATIYLDNQNYSEARIGITNPLNLPVIGGFTVASLPTSGVALRLAVVTDGTTGSDCSVGGGTSYALCLDSGSGWLSIGGGGGGSGGITSVNGNVGPTVTLVAADIPNAVDTTQLYNTPTWINTLGWSAIVGYPFAPALTPVTQSGATLTFPFGTTKQLVNVFTTTLSQNVTSSSFTGTISAGQFMIWDICEGGTSYTFTAPTNMVKVSGIDPTINTCTSQQFFYDGTNFIATGPAITSNTTPGVLTPTGYLSYPTGGGMVNAGGQIDFTISGGSSVITTGQYDAGAFGLMTGNCTFNSYTLRKLPGTADGSITIELDGVTNSAPPATPVLPNTTTNKLSASAPMTISSGSASSGGTTATSTWSTAGSWFTFAVNVTSVTNMTGVAGTIRCQ